ncbi:MAG TPA: cytochrome c [Gammaproteobacteria bacterium]
MRTNHATRCLPWLCAAFLSTACGPEATAPETPVSAPSQTEPEAPAAGAVTQTTNPLVERGRYLVESIAGCGNCHTPRDAAGELLREDMNLAGAFVIEEPAFTAYAPNITPDIETGIGSWSEDEIARAIREGMRPDGQVLGPPMSFVFYRGISDGDIRAIVAYLKSVPAVRNRVPRTQFNIPLPPSWGPPVESVAEVSRDDVVAYGAYLAGPVGHCIDCHTPLVEGQLDLSRVGQGGNVYQRPFALDFAAVSSNITSHPERGLGAWTDDEIKRAITTGVSRDGRELLPFMAFGYYENISAQDLDALIAYLRTIPPGPLGD